MALHFEGRHAIDNRTSTHYLLFVQSRWGLRTPSMLRVGYPILLLGGGVRFIQAQEQPVTTRSLRIVIECLLTRSILIKMYVHDIYSRFLAEAILYIRQYEYDFITTVTIEIDDSFQS